MLSVLFILLFLPQTFTSHLRRAPVTSTASLNPFLKQQLDDSSRASSEAYDIEYSHGRKARWWRKPRPHASSSTPSQTSDVQDERQLPLPVTGTPPASQPLSGPPEQPPIEEPQQPLHAYAAACAVMRNEHCNVREWVEYHLYIGIAKFYIFDHGSTPSLATLLADHLAAGTVEILHFSTSWQADATLPRYANNTHGSRLTPQSWAYDSCFLWFGARHRFIALLDADEFLILTPGATAAAAAAPAAATSSVPSQPDATLGSSPSRRLRGSGGDHSSRPNITAFLQPFEGAGSIRLHWRLFGPASHLQRPDGCTLLNYDRALPSELLEREAGFQNNPAGYMKSIINTQFWELGCNPHTCPSSQRALLPDGSAYNKSSARTARFDRAYVHHYITRSQQDYVSKMVRGTGNTQYLKGSKVRGRNWKFFEYMRENATEVITVGKELAAACCPQSCGTAQPCASLRDQPPTGGR